MNSIITQIKALKSSPAKKIIDSRIKEFEAVGKGSNQVLFKELCFCILTANSSAERCIKVQNEIGNRFCTLNEKQLVVELKKSECLYYNKRANYIACSQKHLPNLKKILKEIKNENELREWFVKNIKGFGMKEASHFLRNIGYTNFAIIDFHISDVLEKNQLIKAPKTLNRNAYLEIESTLKQIAKKTNLSLAELDLYLWCLETKKILK